MSSDKKRRVCVGGTAQVEWTADLPVGTCREPVTDDLDPAIEAMVEAVAGELHIYLWGRNKDPVIVDVNVSSVEIDDDEREDEILCSS